MTPQSVLRDWTKYLWQTGIFNRMQHPKEPNQWTWKMVKHLISVCGSATQLGEVEELTLIGNYVLGGLPLWYTNPEVREHLLRPDLQDNWKHGNQDKWARKDVEENVITVPITKVGKRYIEIQEFAKYMGEFTHSSTARSMMRTIEAISNPKPLFDQLQYTTELEQKAREGLRTAKNEQARQYYEARVKKYENMLKQQMRQWALIPRVLLMLLTKRFSKSTFMKVFSVNGRTATLNPNRLLAPQLKVSSFGGWTAQSLTTAYLDWDKDTPVFYQSPLPEEGITDNVTLKAGLIKNYHRTVDKKLLSDFILGLGKNNTLQHDLFLWCQNNVEVRFKEATGKDIAPAYAKYVQDRKCDLPDTGKPCRPKHDPNALITTDKVTMMHKGKRILVERILI